MHEYIDKSFEDDQAEKKTTNKPSHGYGRFFVKLYLEYYEGRSCPAEAISCIFPSSLSLSPSHCYILDVILNAS